MISSTFAKRTGAALIAAASLICWGTEATAQGHPPTVRLSYAELPAIPAPVDAGSPLEFILLDQLYAALTRVAPDASVIPDAAAGWDISTDGRTYTFHLRSGMKWTDGTAVTAGDYADAIKSYLRGPESGFILLVIQGAFEYQSGAVNEVAGVKVVDGQTLAITLTSPAAFFPAVVAVPLPFRPPTTNGPTTNGPYRLVEADTSHVLMARNDGFYGAASVAITGILFLAQSPADALAAYRLGDVDIDYSAVAVLDAINADASLKANLQLVAQPVTQAVLFNERTAPMGHISIRRAFSAAIDRSTLAATVLGGTVTPAKSWIAPGVFGHDDTVGLGFDPLFAQAQLADAGYPGGAGFPTVTLRIPVPPPTQPPTVSLREQIANALIQDWRDVLGVTVQLEKIVGFRAFSESLTTNPSEDMASGGWGADYLDGNNFENDAILGFFGPLFGIDDTQFTTFTLQAAVEQDPATRLQLYHMTERNLTEVKAHVMPLYYPSDVLLVKPYVNRRGLSVRDWSFLQ